MIGLERDDMETPRTDKAAFVASLPGIDVEVVDAGFAQRLEQENKNLRRLLDKASRAIDCFMDLRGMTASELKSVHNGICILLEATKTLDKIKAGLEEGE